MSATTFLTQKQLMSKNMPADAMNNPFAQQQKILLYVFPLVFAVSGVNFPIGVLLYWLTTNLWSMGQQFYVIRRNPAPGSPAAEALERRKAAKAARHQAARRDRCRRRGTTAVDDRRAPAPSRAASASSPSGPAAERRRRGRRGASRRAANAGSRDRPPDAATVRPAGPRRWPSRPPTAPATAPPRGTATDRVARDR